MAEMLSLKGQGNQHFVGGRYNEALKCYKEALNAAGDMKDEDKVVIYKNMAAAHFKMHKFQDVVDASSAGGDTIIKYILFYTSRCSAACLRQK